MVRFFGTYQTDESVCLVQELLPHSDLTTHLMLRGRLPEAVARFYASEVCVALKYIHGRGYAYRDVKSGAVCVCV